MRSPKTRIINKFHVFFYVCFLLSGCNNALYFYETDKVSLTLEARPDSSQPVQGNLGIKERIALVAPQKDSNQDAVSAISSFNFNIIPKSGTIFNPIMLQTAFITGDAASGLTPQEATQAAQALVLGGIDISPVEIQAANIVSKLSNADKSALGEITKRDYSTLSNPDFSKIFNMLRLDKALYTKELHEALRNELG